MKAQLASNPKVLHNIAWLSALGLGILFIIMGIVLAIAGIEMNTKSAFGNLLMVGIFAGTAGISAVFYAVVTRLGKQRTRNIFFSISSLITVILIAGRLYSGPYSDYFSTIPILWLLLGLSVWLVITGIIAGILLHKYD